MNRLRKAIDNAEKMILIGYSVDRNHFHFIEATTAIAALSLAFGTALTAFWGGNLGGGLDLEGVALFLSMGALAVGAWFVAIILIVNIWPMSRM